MAHPPPTLFELRRTASIFAGMANVDRTWLALVDATRPGIDLSRAAHRAMMLRWLNSWGCRIRYPRAGEPDLFDKGIRGWWRSWRSALPTTDLARLSDAQIEAVAGAYAALSGMPASPGRTLGPTAAAKALYALRPKAIMPWDAAIANELHAQRDGAAFGRHLRLGRQWASTIITESGVDDDAVPALVGRPTVSLAKLLDEYLFVTVTMAGR